MYYRLTHLLPLLYTEAYSEQHKKQPGVINHTFAIYTRLFFNSILTREKSIDFLFMGGV